MAPIGAVVGSAITVAIAVAWIGVTISLIAPIAIAGIRRVA
jgi:hypothetical protein